MQINRASKRYALISQQKCIAGRLIRFSCTIQALAIGVGEQCRSIFSEMLPATSLTVGCHWFVVLFLLLCVVASSVEAAKSGSWKIAALFEL